jgi:hypothetical protein
VDFAVRKKSPESFESRVQEAMNEETGLFKKNGPSRFGDDLF